METRESSRTIHRWECNCAENPILLGTYDNLGNVYISIRKRHYHAVGKVAATCPRCGSVYQAPQPKNPPA